MQGTIVKTKSELKSAKEAGVEHIIVVGVLADQLKRGKKVALGGAAAIALITAALAAVPFTGGLSALGAAPIAALTGMEIAAIISASAVGIALIVAVFAGYEEISYENGRLELKKKRKP